jgi:hypothetical protein
MSQFLEQPPYAKRDDAAFLAEMNALSAHHLNGCEAYKRIWPDSGTAECLEDLPWLHVEVFKHLDLRTAVDGSKHVRTLLSSATSSGVSSRIALDTRSSEYQSQSSLSVLKDFIGDEQQPLCILDSASALRGGRQISARIAAAMSLKPLASQLYFLLEDSNDPASLKWPELLEAIDGHDAFMVYGFTWMLWLAWVEQAFPDDVVKALAGKRITFVHSGGWKKLEAQKVSPATFDAKLKEDLDPASQVMDFYGLVEQVGMIFPLCPCGYRTAPAWADVLVRDPVSGACLEEDVGQLQLMNTISWGAPYHNVLTEDLGRLVPGACSCGRSGTVFELMGRIPKSEVRGCANV